MYIYKIMFIYAYINVNKEKKDERSKKKETYVSALSF